LTRLGDGGTLTEAMDLFRLTRRRFLASASAAFLAACTRGASSHVTGAAPSLALPPSPIPSGLNPPRGAQLRILLWDQYIWKGAVDQFVADHHATYDIATFYNIEEGIQKIGGGYDVFGADLTDVPSLAARGDILPLSDSYLPHLTNLWPEARSAFAPLLPHAVPYGLNPIGVTFKGDAVPSALDRDRVYDVFWDADLGPHASFFDNYRALIALALLRVGAGGVNTGDQALLQRAKDELLRSTARFGGSGAKITMDWGLSSVAPTYQGGAQASLAKSPAVFTYPKQGAVIVADALTVPASSKDPVLGHLFLDFMMRPDVATENASWVGIAQPVTGAHFVSNWGSNGTPPLTEASFAAGHPLLPLTPDVDRAWQAIWAEVRPVLAARST